MKYLQLFYDGLDSFEHLTDEESGQLIKAIIAYNKGEEYSLKGALNALFIMFKNEIDRTKETYETKCLKNKANGLKGGRPKTQNNPTVKNKTQKTQDKEEDKDKEEDNSNKSITRGFKKPTLNDIQNRCIEMNYSLDAEKFFNYYESNGWKVGRNKMKSWHSALANWNKNDTTKPQPKSFKQQDKEQSNREFEAISQHNIFDIIDEMDKMPNEVQGVICE